MAVSMDQNDAVRVKECVGRLGHDPSITSWTLQNEEYLKELIDATNSKSYIMSNNCEEMKVAEFQNFLLAMLKLKC